MFNQSTKADQRGVLLWGNIENHIEKEASRDGRLCVFNGPVLRSDDPIYRDVADPARVLEGGGVHGRFRQAEGAGIQAEPGRL